MNIDRGEYTAALFIDLKKAFDTVDHEILLLKLDIYGLKGKELNWFNVSFNSHPDHPPGHPGG